MDGVLNVYRIFQLHLTKVNDQLEAEKRDLTVLLDKRNKEIDRLNGNVSLFHNETKNLIYIFPK